MAQRTQPGSVCWHIHRMVETVSEQLYGNVSVLMFPNIYCEGLPLKSAYSRKIQDEYEGIKQDGDGNVENGD